MIEIEVFLEDFFGTQHENAFWLNFTVDKIVPPSCLCPHYYYDIPFYAILTKKTCLTNYQENRSFPWPLVKLHVALEKCEILPEQLYAIPSLCMTSA